MKHHLDPEIDVVDFTRTIGKLVRRVRSTVAEHELSMSESGVLAKLDRDGAATTADLARSENMKPQSMRATLAALEERGFIARKDHPTDGRQVLIELTEQGLEIRRQMLESKRLWLGQAIDQLSTDDQQTLEAAMHIMKRLAAL
jgi:DNA-binding MarR family transcriptional regulator